MNGGGSSKTTTTQNQQPWSAAQPALAQGLSEAQRLYNSGVGAQSYGGSTVVNPSFMSGDAANVTAKNAYANIDGRGLSGQYQDAINNNGLNGIQRSVLNGYYQQAATGGYNPAMTSAQNAFQGIVNSGGFNDEQRAAIANTKGLANSNWSVSPELQRILDQSNTDANTNVSLSNSASGRYGSGSANSAVADAISKNTNSLLYSDLGNFQTRKDAANNSLFNMGQTGVGNVSSAAGNIGNIGQNAWANQSNAINNIGSLGQQGFNNLGAAYQGMQAPLQGLAQSGGFYDDYNTRLKNDELRRFNESQSLPWEQVSRLSALANGAGQLGGTTVQSQPGQNPFLQALGYGATGLGLLGSF